MTVTKGSLSKLSLISSFAVLMSVVSVIFGTPFLRVIRNVYGSLTFWGLLLLFLGGSTLLKADWLSLIVGSVWLTTGISLELEKRKFSFLWNSIVSLAIGFVVCITGLLEVMKQLGVTDLTRAVDFFKEAVKPMMKGGAVNAEMDYTALVLQVPSMVFIVLMLGLAISYLMERRIRFWFRLPKEEYTYKFDFMCAKQSLA